MGGRGRASQGGSGARTGRAPELGEKRCLPGAGIWGTPGVGTKNTWGDRVTEEESRADSWKLTQRTQRRTRVPCWNQALGAWRVKAKGKGAGQGHEEGGSPGEQGHAPGGRDWAPSPEQ